MRLRTRRLVACALVALALSASAAAASPTWLLSAGGTLGPDGAPGKGGAAATFGALVPFGGRWSFGVLFIVDDLGTGLTDLRDPNDGSLLGTVGDLHRWSYGGEWRTEANLRRTKRLEVDWNAGFGYARQEVDRRGINAGAASSITLSTGASFLRPLAGGHELGLSLAYRHAFVSTDLDPGRSTHWATAALEWRWQGTPKE